MKCAFETAVSLRSQTEVECPPRNILLKTIQPRLELAIAYVDAIIRETSTYGQVANAVRAGQGTAGRMPEVTLPGPGTYALHQISSWMGLVRRRDATARKSVILSR